MNKINPYQPPELGTEGPKSGTEGHVLPSRAVLRQIARFVIFADIFYVATLLVLVWLESPLLEPWFFWLGVATAPLSFCILVILGVMEYIASDFFEVNRFHIISFYAAAISVAFCLLGTCLPSWASAFEL